MISAFRLCSFFFLKLTLPLFEFLTFLLLLTQKTFHADIVSVMRKWLKEEELVPEDQRPTTQARAHYVKVSFPPLRISHGFSLFLETRVSLISSGNLLYYACFHGHFL